MKIEFCCERMRDYLDNGYVYVRGTGVYISRPKIRFVSACPYCDKPIEIVEAAE